MKHMWTAVQAVEVSLKLASRESWGLSGLVDGSPFRDWL
jgi:hypothetical protein